MFPFNSSCVLAILLYLYLLAFHNVERASMLDVRIFYHVLIPSVIDRLQAKEEM